MEMADIATADLLRWWRRVYLKNLPKEGETWDCNKHKNHIQSAKKEIHIKK